MESKSSNLKKIRKAMEKSLDSKRFDHTLGVEYTAAALAMRYNEDITKAQTAGLLHDCAKCMPNAKKLKMAEKHRLEISDLERKNPFMLHAKLGAFLAKKKYDVEDEEILDAIRWHTTGRPEMTLLDKIVYVADYIEPKRDKAPNLSEIRQKAFVDLDEALLKILEDTLGYLQDSSDHVDSMTKMTYDYYTKEHKEG